MERHLQARQVEPDSELDGHRDESASAASATQVTPPAAAATSLAGWTAGSLTDAVGFALATAAAGFLADVSHTRWHQHLDGWMDRVELAYLA